MNREILFRGKRIDNGEWIIGGIYYTKNGGTVITTNIYAIGVGIPDIEPSGHFYVDPATVGEYTALNDKNGKRIFEGDIVSAKNENLLKYVFLVKFGICGGSKIFYSKGGSINSYSKVGYPCFFFEEISNDCPGEFMLRKDPLYFLSEYQCEVQGNIYDIEKLPKEVKECLNETVHPNRTA